MEYDSGHGQPVIVLTILAAVLLSIIPLPQWAIWGRPELLAMVLIYWIVALPARVGIGMAWLAGLLQDVVEGLPLGQNALALSVLAYLSLILYQRLRMFTPIQQAMVIFVLIGLHQLINNWVQTLTGTISPDLLFLLPALVSALLWPLLAELLHSLRRSYSVS